MTTTDPGSAAPTPFALALPRRSEELRVSSFRAREEVSRLFRADVQVTTDVLDEALAASLVDEPASLVLLDAGAPVRALHGVIARAEAHGRFLHDRQSLAVTIVPALWRLKRRRTRRIFQEQTTADIAARVLGEWRVPHRFAVRRALPVRGYCVQYDETDHAFLMRLLAEEGLYTFFEHPLSLGRDAAATLVVADTPADTIAIEPDTPLSFERVDASSGMTPREHQVTWFVPAHRSRSTRALQRGYDLHRPRTELRDEAGGDGGEPRLVYEHEGSYEEDLGPRPARARLDQARRKAATAKGASYCRRLLPGARFTLEHHDLASADREYVVTRLEHEGYSAEVAPPGRALYQNRFRCAAADTPIRPPYTPPRPRQVAETAVVVGPAGQEVHMDKLGRIKVQFHWDLEGRSDDRSSCWLRVAQAWAGAGWGAQFIPRVGMEVVVTYLGGDLDRPLVTGCVYNAAHPPPFPPPDFQHRSGFRSASTPSATGSNELSFDDTAGKELFYVHAQHDLTEVVVHDRASRVGGSLTQEVRGAKAERIGAGGSLDVAEDRATRVGRDDLLEVERNQKTQVKGDRALAVEGDATTTVAGGQALEVRGNRSVMVGDPDRPAASEHHAHGALSLSATQRVLVNADEGVVLVCGKASIELTKDKIVLRAPTLEVSASETLECSTKDGPSVTLGKEVEILAKKFHLFTESAALELDRDFKADGASIKLGYDPSKPTRKEDEAEPETKPFTCKLSNFFMAPFANKKYQLTAEGLRFDGETDGEGTVTQDIPKSARQVSIRVWIDKYPEGRQRVYTLGLSDLPPPDSVLGAKTRLKNLGYFGGPLDEVATEAFQTAVADFQADHKDTHDLEATGKLDEGTSGALEEVHGS